MKSNNFAAERESVCMCESAFPWIDSWYPKTIQIDQNPKQIAWHFIQRLHVYNNSPNNNFEEYQT